MKFFNKLSVIGLVVLMFSFMNVANADYCIGAQSRSCADNNTVKATDDEKARICNNSWVGRSESHGNQCKWTGGFVYSPKKKETEFKWSCIENDDRKCLPHDYDSSRND